MAESGGKAVSEDERTVSEDEVSQLDARAEEAAIQLTGSLTRINWARGMGN